YDDTYWKIRYREWNGTNWNDYGDNYKVYSLGLHGYGTHQYSPDIIFDADSYPLLVFYNAEDFSMKLVRRGDEGWIIKTFDASAGYTWEWMPRFAKDIHGNIGLVGPISLNGVWRLKSYDLFDKDYLAVVHTTSSGLSSDTTASGGANITFDKVISPEWDNPVCSEGYYYAWGKEYDFGFENMGYMFNATDDITGCNQSIKIINESGSLLTNTVVKIYNSTTGTLKCEGKTNQNGNIKCGFSLGTYNITTEYGAYILNASISNDYTLQKYNGSTELDTLNVELKNITGNSISDEKLTFYDTETSVIVCQGYPNEQSRLICSLNSSKNYTIMVWEGNVSYALSTHNNIDVPKTTSIQENIDLTILKYISDKIYNPVSDEIITLYTNGVYAAQGVSNEQGHIGFALNITPTYYLNILSYIGTDAIISVPTTKTIYLNVSLSPQLNKTDVMPDETILLNGTTIFQPTGDVLPNLNVSVYMDGVLLGNTTTNATGAYEYLITAPSTDGNYTLMVNTTDLNDIYGEDLTSFIVDTSPPEITILSPKNRSYALSVWFNLSVTDIRGTDWCGYSLDNTENITLSNDTLTNFYDVNNSMAEETHTVTFYCNDTAGNLNSTTEYFNIDLTLPTITLDDPANNTIITEPLWMNLTMADDLLLDTSWWSNDAGITNYTLDSPWDINMSEWPDGYNIIYVWVNDSANNIVQKMYMFILNRYPPEIGFVSPTDDYIGHVNRNWSYINVSASNLGSTNNITAFLDWNKSLVGWWRFNNESGENNIYFRDWSSYGNDGSCTTTTCPNYTNGYFSKGLIFDGSDDYVNAGNDSSLDITDEITIMAWVKPTGTIGSGGYAIISELENHYTQIRKNSGSGSKIAFWHAAAGLWFESNIDVPMNQWSFIVVIFDKNEINQNVKFYLNAVANGTGDTTTALVPTANNIWLGNVDTTSRYFNGTIDEVKIWNRALSPEEINASYNVGLYRLETNITNLADGTYTYTAHVQDIVGDLNQTETRTLTIDTVSPILTLISPEQNYNISSNSIDLTFNITDNLNTSMVCSLYINSTLIITNSSTENATDTTFNNILVSENINQNWTVNCSDGINTAQPLNRTFSIDTIRPYIEFVNPTEDNNSYINKNYTYLNWTLTEINLDTTILNWAGTNETMSQNFLNKTSLTDGLYIYYVWANDTLGNANQTETRTLVIDTINPLIEFVYPTEDNYTYQNVNNTYLNTTVTDINPNLTTFIDWNSSLVAWWRFNQESGENNTFFRDWSSYSNNGINSSNPTYISGKFGSGVKLDDGYIDVGNDSSLNLMGDFSVSVWIKRKVNEHNKIIMGRGSYNNDGWYIQENLNGLLVASFFRTSENKQVIAFNVLDLDTWVHIVFVRNGSIGKFYKNGIDVTFSSDVIFNPTSTSSNFEIGNGFTGNLDDLKIWNRAITLDEIKASYNVGLYPLGTNIINLTDGSYIYTAYAQDLAGNVNSTETRTLTVDTTNPYVNLHSPTNTTYADTNITLNYTSSDTNLDTTWYEYNSTNTTLTTNTTFTALDDQQSTIILWANDTAGNINSTSVTFTVDTTDPLVNIISPADNSYLDSSTITITGTSTDLTLNYTNISLYNSTWVLINSTTNTSASWTVELSGATPDGTYYINATAYDILSGTNQTGITVSVDTIYPTGPTLISPSNNTNSTDSTSDLNWTTVTETNFANYTVQVDNDPAFTSIDYTYNTTTITESNYSVTSSWSDAKWYWRVIAYDLAGNSNTSGYFVYTVDTTAPTITLDAPTNTSAINSGVWINFTITDATTSISQAWWSNDSGTTNYTLNSPYDINTTGWIEGTKTINIWANDTLNNLQAKMYQFTIDDTLPNIYFVNPTPENDDSIKTNYTYINVTATDTNNITAFIDWNRSLLAWWRFNNNTDFTDHSTYSNDATEGESTYIESGRFGGARTFDGVNDYVTYPYGVINTIAIAGKGTFEFWFMPTETYNSGRTDKDSLISSAQITVWGNLNFNLVENDGRLRYSVASKTEATGLNQYLYSTTNEWILGKWYHVVGTWNKTGTQTGNMELFIDGIKENFVNNANTWLLNNANAARFGGHETDAVYSPAKVKLDEIRFYTRILNAEEINASYNAGLYRLEANITDLTEGTYTYTAYAQDLAGNINQTETRTLMMMLPTDNAYVDDDSICASNTPCFTAIQASIDSGVVNQGATIYVYNGTYTEQVNITKNVILEAENNADTQLVGGFNVSVNGTIINNFNITGGYIWDPDGAGLDGTYKAGIYVISSNNSFENNNIANIQAEIGIPNGNEFNPSGTGGTSSGIYLLFSTNNNITSNNIYSLTGGTGGTGEQIGSSGGSGGISSGIYLSSSTHNDITLNDIYSLAGGTGGTIESMGASGSGGTSSGIYLSSSTYNNIISNNISSLIVSVGGTEGADGADGTTAAIWLETDSYDNTITALSEDAPDPSKLNKIDERPILYFYNRTGLNISDFNITSSTAPILIGGSTETGEYHGVGGVGGLSTGIALINVNDSMIESNMISDFGSMSGGSGSVGEGGTGGTISGIYLLSSTNNNITSNNISSLVGGTGGIGGTMGPGGAGGTSSAIYLSSSISNDITSNTINSLTGGVGGARGFNTDYINGVGGTSSGIYLSASISNDITSNNISSLSGGGLDNSEDINGTTAAIWIDTDSYDNTMTALSGDAPDPSKLNKIDERPILYFYNKTGLNISDFNIISSTAPILIGGSIETGEYQGVGGVGGLSIGIALIDVNDSMIENNIISDFSGMSGGTGGFTGIGGSGGTSIGIYLYSSTSNNITLNDISSLIGGTKGNGYTANGTSGNGVGLYFTTSDSNRITDTNITDSAEDYDVYSVDDADNYIINATFNSSRFSIIDTSSLKIQWYLDVYVNDSLGNLIENANVTAWQNNGTQAFTDLTDVSGNIERQTLTEYMQDATAKYYIDYVNYTVNATKFEYSNAADELNLTENRQIYLTLSDTTPPSISIQSPIATTYGTLQIDLNYSAQDTNGISTCIYELNGANTTLPTCANTTITAVEGNNNLKLYVNDTADNWNMDEVDFTVSLISLQITKLLNPDILIAGENETIDVNTTVKVNQTQNDVYSINITDEIPYDFCNSTDISVYFKNSTTAEWTELTSGLTVDIIDLAQDNNTRIQVNITNISETNLAGYIKENDSIILNYSMYSPQLNSGEIRIMYTNVSAADINSNLKLDNYLKNISASGAVLRGTKSVYINPANPQEITVTIVVDAIGDSGLSEILLSDFLPIGATINNKTVTFYNNSNSQTYSLYNDTDYHLGNPAQDNLPDGIQVDIYHYNFTYNYTNWSGTLYDNDSITIIYNATILGGGSWLLPTILGGYDPSYKAHIRTEMYTEVNIPLFDIILNMVTKTVLVGNPVTALLTMENVGGPKAKVDVVINYAIKTMAGDLITESTDTIAVIDQKERMLELDVPADVKEGRYTFEAFVTYTGREAISTRNFNIEDDGEAIGDDLLIIIVAIMIISFMMFLILKQTYSIKKTNVHARNNNMKHFYDKE
ncbi:MAG: hypothetical protein GQ477_05505, partial [Nanohaloarchaea archaeon]|nr:hypothetical protein [Candidatus Nanohaloarchaea archaeon]